MDNIIEAHALRAKITILLDENLFMLKDGLKDAGLKVITIASGTPDEKIIELAEGLAILTKNSQDFLEDAVSGDFDVISVEGIKYLDTDKTRKNQTVKKIINAIRDSGLYLKKGHFNLIVKDDGSFHLKELII